jgi:hypothetical protein
MEKNAFFLVRFRNARERHFKKGRATDGKMETERRKDGG